MLGVIHEERDKRHARFMISAAVASISVASVLVIFKSYVWYISGSVALLGSLVDSGLDLLASLITLIAVKTALAPPDEEHRFGHGKAEALAGFVQALVMGVSAVLLLRESIGQILKPAPLVAPSEIILVSLLAIGLSIGLVVFQSFAIKRTGSIAIAGDHLHYKGDLLLNLLVIFAAYSSAFHMPELDGIMGALIGGFILYSAYGVVRPALAMLMDEELGQDEREAIFNIVMGNADVLGLHNLKTRVAGRDRFIQLDIQVDGNLSVSKGHAIASEVEAALSEVFHDTHIFIHVDPADMGSDVLTSAELGIME